MQPSLEKFLKENKGLTERDYRIKYIGDYKGHHRKIKSAFYSPRILKQKDNQVSPDFARAILSGKL